MSKRPRAIAPRPRIAVCTCPGVIYVNGSRGRAYQLTAGAEVDLDEVIGDCAGEPVTMADALGHHLSFFTEAAPSAGSTSVAPAADQE